MLSTVLREVKPVYLNNKVRQFTSPKYGFIAVLCHGIRSHLTGSLPWVLKTRLFALTKYFPDIY